MGVSTFPHPLPTRFCRFRLDPKCLNFFVLQRRRKEPISVLKPLECVAFPFVVHVHSSSVSNGNPTVVSTAIVTNLELYYAVLNLVARFLRMDLSQDQLMRFGFPFVLFAVSPSGQRCMQCRNSACTGCLIPIDGMKCQLPNRATIALEYVSGVLEDYFDQKESEKVRVSWMTLSCAD